MALNLVEGWTEDIDYLLKIDNTTQDLTGMSVALVARNHRKATLSLSGTTSIASAADGKVRFAPAAGDLLAANSPMLIRWKVTDPGGQIAYFPNGTWEEWIIRK